MAQFIPATKKLGRNPIPRKVGSSPPSKTYIPKNIKNGLDKLVIINHDEYETIRLKHVLGYGVVDGAVRMGISKSLFAQIHSKALEKLGDALVNAKELYIQTDPNEDLQQIDWGFQPPII